LEIHWYVQLNYNETYSATSFTSFWKVELSIIYMIPLENNHTITYACSIN